MVSAYNRGIIEEFRANGGRIGGDWADTTIILIHHVGAKTGTRRVTPVACAPRDEGRFVVIASNGGAPTHPHWYRNLTANPRTTVELGTEKFCVLAEELTGDAYAETWSELVGQWPSLAEFQARTTRRIPLVLLTRQDTAKPAVVPAEQWQQARDELLSAEKEATHLLDALAARRRRLPMTRFGTGYEFDTPDGRKTLLGLFDGRDELVVYQFMNNGPDHYCPGCTWYTDNIPAHAPAMLADKGISYVTASNMPLAQLSAYWQTMGWTIPYVSSRGTTFADDTGAGAGFMLTFFLRDGDEVYRTYNTTSRGYEKLAFVTGLLDMSVYGRRERWEDSPAGWPQGPTYQVPTTMAPGQVSLGFGTFR